MARSLIVKPGPLKADVKNLKKKAARLAKGPAVTRVANASDYVRSKRGSAQHHARISEGLKLHHAKKRLAKTFNQAPSGPAMSLRSTRTKIVPLSGRVRKGTGQMPKPIA